jgi:hypothetical protein
MMFAVVALSSGASAPTSVAAADGNAGASGADCSPLTQPVARVDGAFDHLFSDQRGPGWVGGDATYSTALPDGEEAFDFSDTLIGTARPGGSARIIGVVQNSELIGSMPDLKSRYEGTYRSPQPLIPDTRGHGDEWQVAATYVESGEQMVFVNEFAPRKGPFDRFTGRSGIAVLSDPASRTPVLQSIVALAAGPRTQWGNAVTFGASYMYIYGAVSGTSTGSFSGMKLARVPLGHSLTTHAWQYWNGKRWEAGEAHAVVIHTGNELTGVMPQDGRTGYEAVSIPASVITDRTVDLSYSCSPEGPWSTPVSVYSVPQATHIGHEFAYIPTFHPELSPRGAIVISYNIDTTDGLSALRRDVHAYQPRFLEIGGRASPPSGTTTPTTVIVIDVDGD